MPLWKCISDRQLTEVHQYIIVSEQRFNVPLDTLQVYIILHNKTYQ